MATNSNTPGTPTTPTTPEIDAGKKNAVGTTSLDIIDFSIELNKIPDLTRKSVEKTFRNFDDLQKDVANKQKSYNESIRKQ